MNPTMKQKARHNSLAQQTSSKVSTFRTKGTVPSLSEQSSHLPSGNSAGWRSDGIVLRMDYLSAGTNGVISQRQGGIPRGARNPMSIKLPASIVEERNSLAHIAGSYADDPNWDEFMQAIEASRLELDEQI